MDHVMLKFLKNINNRLKLYFHTIIIVALVVLYGTDSLYACLTFCLENGGNIVYGRNFDWPVETGAVFVNPRNIKKKAFVFPLDEKPMTWVSKYGSVTFNQFSIEVPVGGMNETGLVIECMMSKAVYSRRKTDRSINELQWIQYHLDTCKHVNEVIKSAQNIRICPYAANLHYLISDTSGQSAAIEFIKGKMACVTGKDLPVKALANKNYNYSLKALKKIRKVSGKRKKQTRFARAAIMLENYKGGKEPVQYAFDILDTVSQGNFTKWQIVYDISHKKIYFRSLHKHKIKIIGFSQLNFKKIKEPLILNMNTDAEGNATALLKPYTKKINDNLMNTSLENLKKAGYMRHITDQQLEYIKKIVNMYKTVTAQHPF